MTFNKRTAKIFIRLACFAGLLSCFFTFLAFVLGNKGYLLGAVLLFALSLIVLLPSRTAAIGLLGYMVYSKFVQWFGIASLPPDFGEIGLKAYIIGLLWVFIFFLGVLGARY